MTTKRERDIPNLRWRPQTGRALGIRFAFLVLGPAALTATASAQQNDGSVEERLENVESELDRQKQENAALRKEIETIERRQFEMVGGVPADDSPDSPGSLAAKSRAAESRYGSQGGIFSKPFLHSATRQAYLGGYIDLEYHDERGENNTFTQHRFVPFIYVDATDKLKFAAEIEFEYGGSDAPGGDGETKVEFATMDYVFTDAVAFRAGAILVPLGKFNLIHDSPVNDLTDRPLVSRFVVPTTLTEAGLGLFGTVPPFSEWEITYEAYLVNGFRGLDDDGNANFSEASGLRSGRASLETDNNNSIAGVGRVSISPVLGTEIGTSVYLGKYDESGDLWLTIWAVDTMVKPGRWIEWLTPLELQGELASATLERNDLARGAGIPDTIWGVYGQLNYHFMFDSLVSSVPVVFNSESTFTAVARIDHVEMGTNREQRVTVGMNFRPIEDTVFKFDYQFNFEDWHRDRVDNDAFVFSVATYF